MLLAIRRGHDIESGAIGIVSSDATDVADDAAEQSEEGLEAVHHGAIFESLGVDLV